MQHASPTPPKSRKRACPVCQLTGADAHTPTVEQERLAGVLWESYRTPAHTTMTLRRLALEGHDQITPAQLKNHFQRHRVVQPPPSRILRRDDAYRRVASLPERHRDIIDSVWRGRVLTTTQIAQLHYGDASKAVLDRVRGELNDLAHQHLVYRYQPKRPNWRRELGPQAWLIGRDAQPWLERRYAIRIRPEQLCQRPSQAGVVLIPHDVAVNDIVVQLRVQASTLKLEPAVGVEARLGVTPDNWYGPRQLSFRFWDPYLLTQRHSLPDALMAIGLEAPRALIDPSLMPAPLRASMLMPFFVEYDRGSRKTREVADQIIAYLALAQSDALAQRFPDLAHRATTLADGTPASYRVPMLIVFADADKQRRTLDRFGELVNEHAITQRGPIVCALEEDVRRRGLSEPIIRSVWPEQRDAPARRLLTVLAEASSPLVHLDARSTLRLEPSR